MLLKVAISYSFKLNLQISNLQSECRASSLIKDLDFNEKMSNKPSCLEKHRYLGVFLSRFCVIHKSHCM